MTKHCILIFVVLLSSFLLLMSLKENADLPNTKRSGFERIWINNLISLEADTAINPSLSRFCGTVDGDFFIGTNDPSPILRISPSLIPNDTIAYPLPKIRDSYSPNIISVDSSEVSILLPNSALLFRASTESDKLDSVRFGFNLFTRFAKMSNMYAVVRTLSKDLKSQVFQIMNLHNGEVIKASSIVQNDNSIMSLDSDGILRYDPVLKLFIYVEYYRNKVYCFDTALNTKYISKTIDTISGNRTSYAKLEKAGSQKITTAGSRLIVNRDCIIDSERGLFFIQSNIKSDNETLEDFNRSSTFDVYRIENGDYVASFRIIRSGSGKVKSSIISSPYLMLLEKAHISKYRINYSKI